MIDYGNLCLVVNSVGLQNVLQWLGFRSISEDRSSFRACCAVHGGDRPDSFCIYKDTLIWKCFSHKCEMTYGSGFFALIAAVKGCSKRQAVDEFCSAFGVDKEEFTTDNSDKSSFKLMSYVNTNSKEQDIDIKFPTLVGTTDYFRKPEHGGFSDDTINTFMIDGYFIDKSNRKRVFIPILDKTGKLIAYSGRAEDNLKFKKYLNAFGPFAGSTLYNFNMAIQSKSNYIIVVEGFKSVWRLYELGFTNVVSALGSALKQGQVENLLLTLKDVVLLFDNDDAGRIGMDIAIDRYSDVLNIIPIYYDRFEDPADLPKEYLLKLVENYK